MMRSNKSVSRVSMNQTKRKSQGIEWPDWIHKALLSIKPPERMTVSEWADKHRVLDEKTAAESGQWKTNKTPYLREIMDAFTNPNIEEIIFCKPTQVGGTESLNNMLGYIIAQDPSPTMIVYPSDKLAEYTSENRLAPMFKLSEVLRSKYLEYSSKKLELQFESMYIALSGANSPSTLASKPIRFLLMDEVDKFPTNAGKEADPRQLAKERQNTFTASKKTYQASTPTFSHGQIWKEWMTADDQKKYFVPCPHCGESQEFVFKQIKCSKTAKSDDDKKATAYYECIKCNGMITDAHKMQMLKEGYWKSIRKTGTTKTAYHLNAIYSPWLRFGDVLYKYLTTKDDPELFQNFVNSWLAQPWEQTEVKMDADIVLKRMDKYPELVVPDKAILLTGGVDVQKNHFYWTIRAWGPNMTSWNIAHGICESYGEIEDIMNDTYMDLRGNHHQVKLCAMDSGWDTDEVYTFCSMNSDWLIPVKGSSNKLVKRYTETKIDKPNSKANGLYLYIVDGAQYKEMIAARLKKEVGQGAWMVYDGCDRKYADQICSEEKVRIKKGGREFDEWKVKEGCENHFLDTEVYAAMAADLVQVRYLTEDDVIEDKPKEEKPQSQQNEWIKPNENWFRR